MATILVVDDRAANRDFLMTLLGYGGHAMLEESSGAAALATVRARHPDLVITDILMPELDGYDFVRLLRSDPDIASTRVVFYTATYLEGEARSLAEACGVRHIIVKPCDPESVMRIVNDALGVPAALPVGATGEEFDREHLRVLTAKLHAKVGELERANEQLEERVRARTEALTAATEHLRELVRMKDEFLAIVSHDMKSPLSGISAVTELIRRKGSRMPEARRHELLQSVSDAAEHLNALITDLLDLARHATGRVELEPTEVRLSEVVDESIRAQEFNTRAKGISVALRIEAAETSVQADRLKVEQIVNNLLTNAIKFTPRNGQVTVTVEPEQGGARLSVADTGVGMSTEILKRIFDLQKPTSATGTAGERGTGLGLAIVRQWVDLHGGRIEVQSEVARGSTFVVHLPKSRGAH